MGWGKEQRKHKTEGGVGIKIGFWNKGGALQPLKEKINEIENLIKSHSFSLFGVVEANFFAENSLKDINIPGYTFFWDKGRNSCTRRNARCVLYVHTDLSCKLRHDLMKENVPEV